MGGEKGFYKNLAFSSRCSRITSQCVTVIIYVLVATVYICVVFMM